MKLYKNAFQKFVDSLDRLVDSGEIEFFILHIENLFKRKFFQKKEMNAKDFLVYYFINAVEHGISHNQLVYCMKSSQNFSGDYSFANCYDALSHIEDLVSIDALNILKKELAYIGIYCDKCPRLCGIAHPANISIFVDK